MSRYRILEDSHGFEIIVAPEFMQDNRNFITYDTFVEAKRRALELYETRIIRLEREIKNLTNNMDNLITKQEAENGTE